MKAQEMRQILAFFSATYPNFKVTEVSTQVWCQICSDITYQEAQAGAVKYCRENTFPPVPANLVQLVKASKKLNQKDPNQVWEWLVTQFSKGDRGRQEVAEKADSKTKSALRQLGGFNYLSTTNLDSLRFARKDFISIYEQATESEEAKQENNFCLSLVTNLAQRKLLK